MKNKMIKTQFAISSKHPGNFANGAPGRAPREAGTSRRGFTLIELLVVIAIIAILASMLLPVISLVQKSAQKTKAKLEISQIGAAIQQYESQYSRLPVSTYVQQLGSNWVTFGGSNYINASSTSWPPQPAPANYISSNSDVMAILLNITNFPNSTAFTVNTNYQKNPMQTIFLKATMVSDASSPGVGTDLNYRDPWGNPYIISLDMNEDNKTEDLFYYEAAVSSSTGVQGGPGLNNLVYQPTASGGDGNYAYHANYMIWSMGPNGPFNHSPSSFDATKSALDPSNKGHITSWQQ